LLEEGKNTARSGQKRRTRKEAREKRQKRGFLAQILILAALKENKSRVNDGLLCFFSQVSMLVMIEDGYTILLPLSLTKALIRNVLRITVA